MPTTLTTLADRARRLRWADLLTVLTLTLYRDRALGADVDATTLRLSDRTVYVPRLTISDDFERADSTDPGASWTAYGTTFTGLHLAGNAVRPSSVGTGDEYLEVYDSVLARDQWAEITLGTFSAAADYVQAGAVVRGNAPPDATPNFYCGFLYQNPIDPKASTSVSKFVAGVNTPLADGVEVTPAAGDVLRVEAQGTTLRLYFNGLLVLTTTDTSLLDTGRAGVEAWVGAAGAVTDVTVQSFRAGPLREPILGRVLRWSPIGHSLDALNPESAPATAQILLSNLQGLPGDDDERAAVDRFSDLLRIGSNTSGWDARLGDVALDLLFRKADGLWQTLGLDSIPLFRGVLDGDPSVGDDGTTVTLQASSADAATGLPSSSPKIETASVYCPEGTSAPEEAAQWGGWTSYPGSTLEFGGGVPTVYLTPPVQNLTNAATDLLAGVPASEITGVGQRVLDGQEAYTQPWLIVANGSFTQIRFTFDISISGGAIGDVDPSINIKRAGLSALPANLHTGNYFDDDPPGVGSYTTILSEHPATLGAGRTVTSALNTASPYTFIYWDASVDYPAGGGTYRTMLHVTKVELLL